MSSSASRVDLVSWKEICVRFYLHGDETARDALSAFERGQAAPRTGPDAEQSCGQPASTLDSETNLKATELLASVGLTNVASLDTETLSACIASKNAARRESHAVMEKKRRAKFDAVLGQSLAPEKSPPSQVSTASSVAMLTALSNFQRTYASNPAVQPFLNGLAALLRKQHRSPTVWRWIVVSEAFTERAFPTFMEDAVVLLCGFFRYVPPSASSSFSEVVGAGESSPGSGGASFHRTQGLSNTTTTVAQPAAAVSVTAVTAAVPIDAHGWDVEPSLSDKQLTRMLDVLQPIKMRKARTHAGMTGKLVDTGVLRVNQGGDFEDLEDLACPSCALQ